MINDGRMILKSADGKQSRPRDDNIFIYDVIANYQTC